MLSLIYTAFLLSWTEGRIFGPVFQPNAGLYGAIGLQPNLGLYRGSGFQPHAGLYGASGFQSNLGLYRGSGFQPHAGLYVGSSSQDKDDALGGELLDFESAGRRDKDSSVDEHVSIGGVSSDNKWSVDRIGSSGSDRTVTFQEIFGGNGDHRNSDHAISDGFNSNGRLHTGNRLYSERRFKVTGIGKPTGNPTAGDISISGSNNALENSTGQTLVEFLVEQNRIPDVLFSVICLDVRQVASKARRMAQLVAKPMERVHIHPQDQWLASVTLDSITTSQASKVCQNE